MPVDLKVSNSDLFRVNGKQKTIDKKDELLQSLKNRLLTRKGEYFLDIDYGLDYENIFPISTKFVDDEIKKMSIRECLFQDERIISIESIDIKHNQRQTDIKFKAISVFGAIEGGVEIA